MSHPSRPSETLRRLALAVALALAAPAAPAEPITFITGTIDSFEAEGFTDANGHWSWTPGAAAPTVSESNGVRRLAFALAAGQALEYHPHPEGACPANGTADVVVSNALLHIARALPPSADPAHQASITAARPAGASEPAYYGWAGRMTNGAPVWIRLAGATPVDGAEVDVTMTFNYAADPATVAFRVGDAALVNATNASETAFALATSKRRVNYLSFTGSGSIGAMAGTLLVFDATPPAVEPGEGLLAGDPPAVETTEDGFVVRFRTRRAGVTYTLLSSEKLSRDDADWTPVDGAKAVFESTAAAETEAGELVALEAPVGGRPVQFFRIRAEFTP